MSLSPSLALHHANFIEQVMCSPSFAAWLESGAGLWATFSAAATKESVSTNSH
jgi:hypothetical protein